MPRGSDPDGGAVPTARLEDCDDADAGRVWFQSSTGFLSEVSPSTGHTTPLHAGGPGPWLDPTSLVVAPLSDRCLGLVPDWFGATSVFAFDAEDLAAPEDLWVSVPQAGFAGLVWVEDPPN